MGPFPVSEPLVSYDVLFVCVCVYCKLKVVCMWSHTGSGLHHRGRNHLAPFPNFLLKIAVLDSQRHYCSTWTSPESHSGFNGGKEDEKSRGREPNTAFLCAIVWVWIGLMHSCYFKIKIISVFSVTFIRFTYLVQEAMAVSRLAHTRADLWGQWQLALHLACMLVPAVVKKLENRGIFFKIKKGRAPGITKNALLRDIQISPE